MRFSISCLLLVLPLAGCFPAAQRATIVSGVPKVTAASIRPAVPRSEIVVSPPHVANHEISGITFEGVAFDSRTVILRHAPWQCSAKHSPLTDWQAGPFAMLSISTAGDRQTCGFHKPFLVGQSSDDRCGIARSEISSCLSPSHKIPKIVFRSCDSSFMDNLQTTFIKFS